MNSFPFTKALPLGLISALLLVGCTAVQADVVVEQLEDSVGVESLSELDLPDVEADADSSDESIEPVDEIEGLECHLGLNWGSAMETVTYSDPARGIQFEFPYSPTWVRGAPDVPFNETRYAFLTGGGYETLRFGPIATVEGCSIPQYYTLKFYPAGYDKTPGEPTMKSFGGVDVFEYDSWGMAHSKSALQIRGSQYTYEFSAFSGDEDEMEVLEWIAETVQFL